MPRYVKLPIPIEASQWNKDATLAIYCTDHLAVRSSSYEEISLLCGTSGCSHEHPHWSWSVMGVIDTLEGKHVVSPGDWIITGVRGEHYPCKPDVFETTYISEQEYAARFLKS
jgi:hypothetical protein